MLIFEWLHAFLGGHLEFAMIQLSWKVMGSTRQLLGSSEINILILSVGDSLK
jgi:hypothetical protein